MALIQSQIQTIHSHMLLSPSQIQLSKDFQRRMLFQMIKSSWNSLYGMPCWDKMDSLCCLKCTSWKIGLLLVLWDSRLSLLFCFGSSCVLCISLWLEMGHRVLLASTPLHLCPTSLSDCLPTRTSRWVSSAKAWWLCDSDSEWASGVGWILVGLLDH